MDNGADGEVRPGAEVGTREAQGEGDDAEGAHGERPVTTAGGEVDQLRRELGAAKADIRVKDEYIAVLEVDLDEARRALEGRPGHRLAEQAKAGLRRLRRTLG